jgi:hypothetical protein
LESAEFSIQAPVGQILHEKFARRLKHYPRGWLENHNLLREKSLHGGTGRIRKLFPIASVFCLQPQIIP